MNQPRCSHSYLTRNLDGISPLCCAHLFHVSLHFALFSSSRTSYYVDEWQCRLRKSMADEICMTDKGRHKNDDDNAEVSHGTIWRRRRRRWWRRKWIKKEGRKKRGSKSIDAQGRVDTIHSRINEKKNRWLVNDLHPLYLLDQAFIIQRRRRRRRRFDKLDENSSHKGYRMLNLSWSQGHARSISWPWWKTDRWKLKTKGGNIDQRREENWNWELWHAIWCHVIYNSPSVQRITATTTTTTSWCLLPSLMRCRLSLPAHEWTARGLIKEDRKQNDHLTFSHSVYVCFCVYTWSMGERERGRDSKGKEG